MATKKASKASASSGEMISSDTPLGTPVENSSYVDGREEGENALNVTDDETVDTLDIDTSDLDSTLNDIADETKPITSDAKFKSSQNGKLDPETEKPALQKFFTDSIKDIFWAENHLVKALPKMILAATSNELKSAITDHLEETKGHVTRLEEVFEKLGEKVQAKKCDAMEGISKEGEGVIEETDAGSYTRDVAIIMASQKVEHYEIAAYGGLVQLANTLGLSDIATILNQTLDEEKTADQKLTTIAENSINEHALQDA